ncbi:MAG TPA: hypothetical protein VN673_06800 [Clostridia bacterium]|nr:hypothetical protein [Clostridia bacterium]
MSCNYETRPDGRQKTIAQDGTMTIKPIVGGQVLSEIPQQALDLHYNSGGFLPDVGLYRRGDLYYQKI